MSRSRLVFLVALAMVGCRGADAPRSSAHELSASMVERLTTVPFLDVRNVEDIPSDVLAQVLPDSSGGMSSPGERFQATDVLEDPALPRTRLVFGAKSPDLWVIAFEHGGRGRHDHVVILSVEGTRWHPVFAWRGDLAETKTSANPFLHLMDKLLKGAMRNELDHRETIRQ